MIILQLILFCLFFSLMVAYAVRGGAINAIYFYPKAVQERAVEIGLTDEETIKSKRKRFMVLFYIVMAVTLILIVGLWNQVSDFKEAYFEKLAVFACDELV